MDLHQLLHLLVTSILVSESYLQDISGWQSHYLDGFRFIPILGQCYQVYHTDDVIATCRREPDLQSQSCIQWTSNDRSCVGLTTPTNETIVLRCTNHIRFDTCFELYDADQNLNLACQEIIEGHAVGIRTPDNFTILLHSDLCRTSTNLMERGIYSKFVNTFSLDVDTKSCYKIYGKEELVDPYNCLSPEVEEACVFEMEHGCTALMTSNNEVLILDCPNDKHKHNQENCFYLYSSDNQVHTVCQVKLEERCVGVVTPSNLTVLFECFFCSEFMNIVYYNRENQKKQRQFVKNYLAEEYLGNNSYSIDAVYTVLDKNQVNYLISPNWVTNTSCYGIELMSNETIFFKCMAQTKNLEQPVGCFSMISTDNEKQSVCVELLNEACVGLKISKNVSIALACYGTDDRRVEHDRVTTFFLNFFQSFLNNEYRFNSYFFGYKEKQGINSQLLAYQLEKLEDKPDCLGVKIENELVILECPSLKIKRNGCFDVIKKTVGGEELQQIQETCLKILDDKCVGITTPNNWTLPFDCFADFAHSKGQTVSENLPGMFASSPCFISQNIPNYNLPPRY